MMFERCLRHLYGHNILMRFFFDSDRFLIRLLIGSRWNVGIQEPPFGTLAPVLHSKPLLVNVESADPLKTTINR